MIGAVGRQGNQNVHVATLVSWEQGKMSPFCQHMMAWRRSRLSARGGGQTGILVHFPFHPTASRVPHVQVLGDLVATGRGGPRTGEGVGGSYQFFLSPLKVLFF